MKKTKPYRRQFVEDNFYSLNNKIMNKEKVKEILIKYLAGKISPETPSISWVAEQIDNLYNPKPEQSLRKRLKTYISRVDNSLEADFFTNKILEMIREEIEKQPYDACRKITILELLK